MALALSPGQTYPPTPDTTMTPDEYFTRGPYLARTPEGLVYLRVPSPYYHEEARQQWRYYSMQWDRDAREWFRLAPMQLEMLELAIRHYERFFPEYAERRPTWLPSAILGRVDFIVGNPQRVTIQEWRRGWSAGDPFAHQAKYPRHKFRLEKAIAWCEARQATIVHSHDQDYIRVFFDGQRSIRTAGQIMAKRRRFSLAQADFAYQ